MSSEATEIITIFIFILGLGLIISLVVRLFLGYLETKRLKANPHSIDGLLIQSLKSPLYWTILTAALYLALSLLTLTPSHKQFIDQVLLTYLVIIWIKALDKFTVQSIRSIAAVNEQHRSPIKDAVPFLTSLSRIIIMFFGLYLVFLAWDVNLTPLMALISVIGAALSFAARDVVGNVLSGMSIFFSRPFKVGDYIKIDDQFQGTVKEIGLQMTQVEAESGSLINLPNSILVTKAVINHMGLQPNLVLTLPLTLPLLPDYTDLIAQIQKVTEDNKWLLPQPKPRLRFQKNNKESVQAHLIVYLDKISHAAKVRHQLLKAITPLLLTPKS